LRILSNFLYLVLGVSLGYGFAEFYNRLDYIFDPNLKVSLLETHFFYNILGSIFIVVICVILIYFVDSKVKQNENRKYQELWLKINAIEQNQQKKYQELIKKYNLKERTYSSSSKRKK
jgi:hypothetical protein